MKIKNHFTTGVLLGILGIVMFSSKAVMVKLAYKYQIDAIGLLLLRMLFSFPFYVAIALIYGKRLKKGGVAQKDYPWLAFFGFVGYYLASFFDFEGLIHIKASLERIILFLYPTMVIIINRLFFRQTISKKQMTAILLTYVGVVITFAGELELAGEHLYLGGFFVFLSALTYASYLAGSGWLIPKFGVLLFTAYSMIVSCICVFIHYILVHDTGIFDYPWQVYVLGGCIAVFATVIPSFLVSASIKLINSSNFSIIASVGPISTIILAIIFLDESLSLIQFIGALIVITGVLVVTGTKKSKSL